MEPGTNDSHVWATVFGSKTATNELPRNGQTLDEVIIALVLGRLGDIAELRKDLFGDSQVDRIGRIIGRGGSTGGRDKFLCCQLGLVVPSKKLLVLFGRHGGPSEKKKVIFREEDLESDVDAFLNTTAVPVLWIF
jgi:hypothetical protein